MRLIKTTLPLTLLLLFSSVFSLSAQAEPADSEAELEELLNSSETDESSIPDSGQNSEAVLIDRTSIPDILVAADFLFEKDLHGERETENNFDLRELEFGFSGNVDQNIEAMVLFAMHRVTHGNDEGEQRIFLHEAYMNFRNLPYNFSARVGQMFLDAGRLNTIHRHDWDFTNAPVVHMNMMNDTFQGEGAADTGAEISYLMPWNFYQELQVGVFRGRTFGHAHDDGHEKPAPLYTARLKNFIPFSARWGTQFGFTYLRYQPDGEADNVDHTGGFDLILKYENGQKSALIWGSEYWYRQKKRVSLSQDQIDHGFYTYLQYSYFRWDFGIRYDFYTSDPVTFDVQNYAGQALWVTFRPSEFSYFRSTVERHDYDNYNSRDSANYTFWLQADFILGFHPAHEY